jgi:hypothetical protein
VSEFFFFQVIIDEKIQILTERKGASDDTIGHSCREQDVRKPCEGCLEDVEQDRRHDKA